MLCSRLKKLRSSLIIFGVIVVSVVFSISTLNHDLRVVSEDPPVPVITSERAWIEPNREFAMWVYATIYNEGGSGTITVSALVMYEYLGHSVFRQSKTIYLNSGESLNVTFIFREIMPVPCGNRHSIPWRVSVSTP